MDLELGSSQVNAKIKMRTKISSMILFPLFYFYQCNASAVQKSNIFLKCLYRILVKPLKQSIELDLIKQQHLKVKYFM